MKTVTLVIPRTCRLPIVPDLIDLMKANGFVFESESCPVKFAGRHTVTSTLDGDIKWTQEIPDDGDDQTEGR